MTAANGEASAISNMSNTGGFSQAVNVANTNVYANAKPSKTVTAGFQKS